MLFKIHEDLLSHHSSVFRDMFGVPQPDGEDGFGGIPVVELSDSKEDLELFFSLMYNGLPFKADFEVIESTLRLTHKYDARILQLWGVHHPKAYPSMSTSAREVYANPHWERYSDPVFCMRMISLTELLDLRELDGVAALAYYALSTCQWETHPPRSALVINSTDLIVRVRNGEAGLFVHKSAIIQQVYEHECSAPTAWASAAIRQQCQPARNAAMQAVMPALNKDFIAVLMEWNNGRGPHSYCPKVKQTLAGAPELLLKHIPAAFGF